MNTPDQVRLKKSTCKLEINTPPQAFYLPYIRTLVTDLARKVGFPADEVSKIEMAVDEACSNVLEHAYSPKKKGRPGWQHPNPEIRLDVRLVGDKLIIEITDHGQTFDFSSYSPPNLEKHIENMNRGGFGISIMRKFMDEVTYASSDQTGNTLRLVKYLKKS
jgi:serine/threonine-protein kinase RsbW